MPISNSARLAGATAFALLTGLGATAMATEPDQATTPDQATIEEGSAAPAPEAQRRQRSEMEAKQRQVRQREAR
jgi:hypothetical protein